MNVEVEILKGISKGKRKTISEIKARALSAVGFLRIVEEDAQPEEIAKPKRAYRRKDMVAEA